MLEALQNYYFALGEPNKSCMLTVRNIILAQDTRVWETFKYGMPCFMFKKKAFCYLWTDKKTQNPYLLFVEGNLLDAVELEQGNRAKMKVFTLDPNMDLPIRRIEVILNQALDLYKKGIVRS